MKENLIIYKKFSQDKEDASIESGMRGQKRKCQVKHSRTRVNTRSQKGTLGNTCVNTHVINVAYGNTLVNTGDRGVV